MTNNKHNNFVGMQVCPYCKEPMGILIQTHFKEIPQQSSTSPEPCDKCKAKFEADGVVPVWEVRNPGERNLDYTGRYAFFRRAAVKDPAMIKMMEDVGFLICDTETMDAVARDLSKRLN